MVPTLLAASAQKKRREITSPSGRVYVWDKDTDPTQADIDALVEFDKQQGKKIKAPYKGPGQPLAKASVHPSSTQFDAPKNKATGMRSATPQEIAASNDRNDPVIKAARAQVEADRGASQRGIINQITTVSKAASKGTDSFINEVNALTNAISERIVPKGPGDNGVSRFVADALAGTLNLPLNTVAEVRQILRPEAGGLALDEKSAKAAANILLRVVPADAILRYGTRAGSALKAGAEGAVEAIGKGSPVLRGAKNTAVASDSIRQAAKSGVNPTITQGVGAAVRGGRARPTEVVKEKAPDLASSTVQQVAQEQNKIEVPPGQLLPKSTPANGTGKGAVSASEGRTIYRETTPEAFWNNDHLRPGTHWATTPDLAIGQGQNKGIIVEWNASPASKFKNNPKPGIEATGHQELIADIQPTSNGAIPGNLASITIKSGAKVPQELKVQLLRFSDETNPNRGYIREDLPNGDVKYTVIKKPPADPPASPVKPAVTAEPPSGPQGISHAAIDDLRTSLGWQPRNTGPAKPDAQLFEDAKKFAGREHVVADDLTSKPEKVLSDEEAVALGVRLKVLKGEMEAAKKANNTQLYDLADAEAQKIADAIDLSGSRQGRAFRARRFLIDDNLDSWTLTRGVSKANLDQPLSSKQDKILTKRIQELEESNAALAREVEVARQEVSSKLPKSRTTGPTTQRASALSSLKKLGIIVADDAGQAAAGGGMGSRQRGAINIPAGSADQVAKHVRTLVRSYGEQGAKDWNDVLTMLKKDLPGIEEEQALFILSGKYKVAKVQADVVRKRAMAFQSQVKKEAEFRMKSFAGKAYHVGTDLLNTTQRSLQTTLDNSMALIQGKNVLMWKPGTWFKSVGGSLRAMAQKDPIGFARTQAAIMENDPLYSTAVQAKLGLSDIDGAFNKQEEFFAGALENQVPGLSHSKAMATVLMNKMRFDLFRKLAAQAPAGATGDYYADIARQINIATGKGSGRMADMLGSKEAGFFAYAPRYYLSKWQHNFGTPFFAAKTPEGQKQALKMYGTQLAFYGGAIKAAQLFGFDVDLDPRSAQFGVATAKDGSYSFDMFHKQAEPVRVMAQLLYGRISKGGKYTEPGNYSDYSPGDYIESKMSAIGRTAEMTRRGTTFDDETGQQRKAEASDYWKSFIPLSLKEMYKNRDKPQTYPASFLGAGIENPKGTPSKAYPFNAVPPGVTSIFGR